MKFKFINRQKLYTPLVGVCQEGDVVEYEDGDPRCKRLLNSPFFEKVTEKPLIKQKKKEEKEKPVKEDEEA